MCDYDDRRRGRDFGPPEGDRSSPDFGPRRERDCRHPNHEDSRPPDPAEWLREAIEDVTEDAFLDMVEERVKARLETVWGEKLDTLVNLVVDHFVLAREREITTVLADAELDAALRDTLKPKRQQTP